MPQPYRFPHTQGGQHKRQVHRQCSYCGKEGREVLRICSLCKSTRYCDTKCQSDDYKARHKDECTAFARPPFTTAFLTEPIGDDEYAHDPIFAQANEEGIGCWVSMSGTMDCLLQRLVNPIYPPKSTQEMDDRYNAAAQTSNARKYYTGNLLTLQFLVQNRRKDKQVVFIYGAQTRVVSYYNRIEPVMLGKMEKDDIYTFAVNSVSCATMGVVTDHLSDTSPRLFIKNFNGKDVTQDETLPSGVFDATRGTIGLLPGQFVLLQAQYRVGDGDYIRHDWEALSCLQALALPYTVQPQLDPRHARGADRGFSKHVILQRPPASCIRVRFNQDAIKAYYRDFIEHDKWTFLESHYSVEEADAWKKNDGNKIMKEAMITFADFGGFGTDFKKCLQSVWNTWFLRAQAASEYSDEDEV